MKTQSILESIRNKMKKIEKNDGVKNTLSADNVDENESHDDFEYIDDSKETLSSNQNLTTKASADEDQEVESANTDFDFLSEEVSEIKSNDASGLKGKKRPVEDLQDLNIEEDEMEEPDFKESKNLNLQNDIDHDDSDLEIDDMESELESSDLEEDLENPEEEVDENEDSDDLDIDLDDEKNVEENIEDLQLEDEADLSEDEDLQSDDDLVLDDQVKEEVFQEDIFSKDLEVDDLDLDLDEENEKDSQEKVEDDLSIDPEEKNMKEEVEEEAQDHEELLFGKEDQDLQESQNGNRQNPRESIISQETAQKTTESIRQLIGSIPKKQQLFQNSSPAFKSGETIEEMVASLLEPKLEQWMNENLPTIVDKIVREEIKKLIPQDNH